VQEGGSCCALGEDPDTETETRALMKIDSNEDKDLLVCGDLLGEEVILRT